ncbi:acyl transferase domain protein [Mycobacterium kansasii 662]|uniref:Acyl transferase domain protein n=1 Tax=Mycobacterium kansasii 662 TaxID=1299326 RepID=X7XP59_MYCKA|nr:acyl transferase domain protein [Mycobacterium kansasii 662]
MVARQRAQAVRVRALAAGQHSPGVVRPLDGSRGPGTVFVYSGVGSQWAGMGRQLLADEPRSPLPGRIGAGVRRTGRVLAA